jgi:hypothetical protein
MPNQKYLAVKNKSVIHNYVSQFASFLEMRSAIYVSSPITTGKEFVHWFNEVGRHQLNDSKTYADIHRSDIINKNLARIKSFAHQLRKKESGVVIEPASYENEEWSQHDYLYYWSSIISKYVYKIICMDGWEYSRGCVFEYLCGRELGLEFETQDRVKLSPEFGLSLINSATKELEKLPYDLQMHRDVYNDLTNLK